MAVFGDQLVADGAGASVRRAGQANRFKRLRSVDQRHRNRRVPRALEYNRGLVEAGCVSPDVRPNLALNNDLMGGTKIAMRGNSWNGYTLWVNTAPTIKRRILRPFAFDGGAPGNLLGPGNFGFTAIKKGTPERAQGGDKIRDELQKAA